MAMPMAIMSDVSTAFWLWAAVTLLMTAAIGFTAGICYARVSVERTCRRARTQLSTLFTAVIGALEAAQETCAFLEKFPDLLLTPEQVERLDRTQNRLLETVSTVVDTQRSAASGPVHASHKEKPAVEKFTIDWELTPEDPLTGLPDESAFEVNLRRLLEAGCRSNTESGLLLVKVDKFAHLTSRFGSDGTKQLMRKMIRVVLRAARDEDLLCHYSGPTFAVLIPAVDDPVGRKLAEAIRNTVREYHFRLDESGPEVLVTASFGYTTCLPDDNDDLALNRAGNALAKSERRGRNQLHVHDGHKLTHCLVG